MTARRLLTLVTLLVAAVVAVVVVRARQVPRPDPGGRTASATPVPPPVATPPQPSPRPARKSAEVVRLDRPSIHDDPAQSGWDTEAFQDAAAGELKHLGQLLAAAQTPTAHDVAEFVTPDVTCGPLRPGPRTVAFADAAVTIERGPDLPAVDPATAKGPLIGAQGVATALEGVAGLVRGGTGITSKFKIDRVHALGDGIVTASAVVQVTAQLPQGRVQHGTVWDMRWRTRPDGPPQLQWLAARDLEESVAHVPGGALFSERTREVLGANPALDQQLAHGVDHWLQRLDRTFDVHVFGGQGLAVGDVNGDGLDDVYVLQQGGLPNRLFVQNPDGTATDRSAEAGVDLLDRSAAALLVDLDGDGDQDLAVTAGPGLLLYANDGQGHFTLHETKAEARGGTSLAAADYDGDGDLDLYVCEYSDPDSRQQGFPGPVPFHDANNGAPNFLYRNEGGLTFRDATKAVGLDANNHRFSFAAAWEDFDGDGDPDLYVANDFGRNNLYRNDRGHFTDIAASAGVEDIGSSMSAAWGDADQDGWFDLYVGDMWSSAGGRVGFQDRFAAGKSNRADLQRFARGNTLLRNTGRGTFQDVSQASGTMLGRWAWSSVFFDPNADGREDLLVANGFLTRPDPKDL